MWNKNTKPTPANIRRRISAAQDAIDGALDLLKKNDQLWPTDPRGQHSARNRYAVPLVNAYDWLADAQRRLTKR